MVQCWIWLVWLVWQLEWTSTWQLGRWSRADCRLCESVTNEASEPPQTSTQEKINILEKTLAVMGNQEPMILAGRTLLEKELEWHQKKLKGPKNTAKQIGAKQKWHNRETKRIEAKSEKLVEMQENIKTWKEAQRAAYEEIKQTSNRPGAGGRIDGQKTRAVSCLP